MTLPSFRTVSIEDRALSRFQDNVATALKPALAQEDAGASVATMVRLTAGVTNPVAHGLGRVLRGWQLAGLNADARVWDSQSTNPTPELTLDLHCSATCIVALRVW